MSDLEKRAHDIAVRILPYTLKEFKPDFTYLSSDEVSQGLSLRSGEIVEEYVLLYEADTPKCVKSISPNSEPIFLPSA